MKPEPEETQARGAREKRETKVWSEVMAIVDHSEVIDVRITEIEPNHRYRVNIWGTRPDAAEFVSSLRRKIIASHFVTIQDGLLHYDPPLRTFTGEVRRTVRYLDPGD